MNLLHSVKQELQHYVNCGYFTTEQTQVINLLLLIYDYCK